jgi:xanthine dehydrogenase small subunit
LIATSEISELCGIREEGNHLVFGGNVSWRELEEWALVNWPNVKDMLDLFASPQIRNRGTISGNLANGSPVADSLPWLYVSEAEIGACDGENWRWIPIDKFYKGYKLLDLQPNELIGAIRIQKYHQNLPQRLFKVSKRRDLDISTFTAAIQWQLFDGRFQQIRLAYGGVGPTVIRLHKTEKVLRGQQCTKDLIGKAGKVAVAEISPITDVRSSDHYRNRLAETILQKFFYEEILVAA